MSSPSLQCPRKQISGGLSYSPTMLPILSREHRSFPFPQVPPIHVSARADKSNVRIRLEGQSTQRQPACMYSLGDLHASQTVNQPIQISRGHPPSVQHQIWTRLPIPGLHHHKMMCRDGQVTSLPRHSQHQILPTQEPHGPTNGRSGRKLLSLSWFSRTWSSSTAVIPWVPWTGSSLPCVFVDRPRRAN